VAARLPPSFIGHSFNVKRISNAISLTAVSPDMSLEKASPGNQREAGLMRMEGFGNHGILTSLVIHHTGTCRTQAVETRMYIQNPRYPEQDETLFD